MTTKFRCEKETLLDIQYVDFGLVDEKNRNIGCRVVYTQAYFRKLEDSATGWYGAPVPINESQTLFGVSIQITRNDLPFGATQRRNWFETVSQAEGFAKKKVNERKTRMTTKFGK